MSPVISAAPEHEDGRVSILIDSPSHIGVDVFWTVMPEPPEKPFWRSVIGHVTMYSGPQVIYHHDAPLNTELSYKALLWTLKGDLLMADEDYTEIVTATLRTAEWRLK